MRLMLKRCHVKMREGLDVYCRAIQRRLSLLAVEAGWSSACLGSTRCVVSSSAEDSGGHGSPSGSIPVPGRVRAPSSTRAYCTARPRPAKFRLCDMFQGGLHLVISGGE